MITTYEEAVQQPIDFTNIPEEVHSLIKLTAIIKHLNEGWQPDWNDDNERKYYIWFYWNGTTFVYYGCDGDWTSFTDVGSRLCFKDRATAEYCAETFIDLWNDYLQYGRKAD